ncbi:MAG: hypothetical protein WA005_09375 [Candidatus Binataceae bacterium]
MYKSATGKLIWTKSVPSIDPTGYKISPVLSGVAAFHTKGTDELRVAAELDTNTGQSFRYQFYNILTGTLEETEMLTATNP